jgi:ParB family transcriptional regulator, chromosome partitioning protein
MDNSKKNIHSSGPLGMLVKTGQIKKVDLNENSDKGSLQHIGLEPLKTGGVSFFRTQSGIEFKENELVLVDAKECEPWEYANRSADEMGNMDALINSIKQNNQLQPALVRSHPNPYNGIKYQIIFGRRRHAACLQLGVPFLVIKKDSLSIQEAISSQNAENKFRKDISHYSNAVLYKKLIDNRAFKNEKELAEKLNLSRSSLNDIMAFTKIPGEIICLVPDIHGLSVYIAVKIVRLLNDDKNLLSKLITIASEIGKSITTPAELDKALENNKKMSKTSGISQKNILSEDGKKLFTFKVDHKGTPCIFFPKDLILKIDFDDLCEQLRRHIELNTE